MSESSSQAGGRMHLHLSRAPGVQLVAVLRAATRDMHRLAERSGIVRELLRGHADVADYALLQRNLLPAYRSMEHALQYRQYDPHYRIIANHAIFRASAIESDLHTLLGGDWRQQLPLLPVARTYAERIAEVGYPGDARLLGHTYTRYLGDLNGGQILKRILQRNLGLAADALTFHEFPLIDDLAAFRNNYLSDLNVAVTEPITIGVIADEAIRSFQCHIELSDAVFAQRQLRQQSADHNNRDHC